MTKFGHRIVLHSYDNIRKYYPLIHQTIETEQIIYKTIILGVILSLERI